MQRTFQGGEDVAHNTDKGRMTVIDYTGDGVELCGDLD
jgi:hypothetical protein